MPEEKNSLGFIIKRINGKVSVLVNPEIYGDMNEVAKKLRNKFAPHVPTERMVELVENAIDTTLDIDEAQACLDRDHIRGCQKCQTKLMYFNEVIFFILRHNDDKD